MPAARSASASTSTSISRWPPRRRWSGRSSRSPPRCRAGTAAVDCSCSTSRPRCCRTTRSSGCSRSSRRCARRARRALRLPPDGRDLRARRPGDGPARRPAGGDERRRRLDPRGLAGLMVGEDVDPDYRAPVAAKPDAPVVLEMRGIAGKWLRGVDLEVRQGEILGIAGLAGAGVLELPYVIAGHAPRGDKVTGGLRLTQRLRRVARRRPSSRTSTSRSSPRTGSAKASSTSSASTRTCRSRSWAGSAGAASSGAARRPAPSRSGAAASRSRRRRRAR